MRGELHFDAVVIGAGSAGLTAATRLAEGGARVCVLAKGIGSTHLAPGTVDVLGYAPDRVEEPARALSELVAARPDHPYALMGVESVAPALQWFAERIADGPQPGYRYVGDLEHNHLLPTAVGVLRPSALVPETMAEGDMRRREPVCIVGTRALRDFHAALCAANLEAAGVAARAIEVDVELDRADANALGLARRFDDPDFRAAFAAELTPRLRGDERVGLPAVLGLRDPHGAWADLQRRLGRGVFEIPTLPPSVPGMRAFEALRAALRAAGGRLVLGSAGDRRRPRRRPHRRRARPRRRPRRRATTRAGSSSPRAASRRAPSRSARTGSRARRRSACRCAASRTQASRASSATTSPSSRWRAWGSRSMRALRAEGAENVLVAGAALPGAVPWREGSGEGIALASGHRAAEVVLAQEANVKATA